MTPYLRETRLGARYCSFLFAFIDLSQAASAKLLQRTSLEVLAAIEPNLESLSVCVAVTLLFKLEADVNNDEGMLFIVVATNGANAACSGAFLVDG